MSGFHVLWRIEIEKWSRENETGAGEKTKSDYAAKAVDSCGITPFGCFGGSVFVEPKRFLTPRKIRYAAYRSPSK